MALLASQSNMPPRQREVAQVMVEGRILPIGRVMTGGTIGAESAAMLIVLLMTGVTIRGRTLIHTVLVAGLALRFGMFAFEFECRKAVVEFGGRPTSGGVTGGAIGAETSFVRLVGTVAGVAILGRVGEVG